MTKKMGFTLAEVLITLAIIGVVAAIAIPSVISNSQQQEFKTGLRKAVSVLNSAITMNMALDGESPYDNANLYYYLQRHMNVVKTTTRLRDEYFQYFERRQTGGNYAPYNAAFYTVDGIRYDFWISASGPGFKGMPLHETDKVRICEQTMGNYMGAPNCSGCGSYGLNSNPDGTTKPPCIIGVDVNGDKKPNPTNINCKTEMCAHQNKIKMASLDGKKLTDVFAIMITDREAIPYGVAAQRAMYQAQK